MIKKCVMKKTLIILLFTSYVLCSFNASLFGAKGPSPLMSDVEAMDIADGEYVGKADDFDGALLEVKVLMKNHKIKEIEIIESKEDGYVYMASGLIPLIVELQSVEIDAVSGATVSSKALFRSIKDAISKQAVR